jgi:hypothetical protein
LTLLYTSSPISLEYARPFPPHSHSIKASDLTLPISHLTSHSPCPASTKLLGTHWHIHSPSPVGTTSCTSGTTTLSQGAVPFRYLSLPCGLEVMFAGTIQVTNMSHSGICTCRSRSHGHEAKKCCSGIGTDRRP